MISIDIPKGDYAVFCVPKANNPNGLADNIKNTWKYIFKDWFDSSDYNYKHDTMGFEYYLGENTYIYVPVEKK